MSADKDIPAPMPDDPSAELRSGRDHLAQVKVRIELGRSRIASDQLTQIEPGSVIELDSKVSDKVEVFVDGRLYARGEAVVVDLHEASRRQEGRFGVIVREIVRGLNRQVLGQYQADSPVPQASCDSTEMANSGRGAGIKTTILAAAMTLALMGSAAMAQSQPASAQSADLSTKPVGAPKTIDDSPLGPRSQAPFDWVQTVQTLGALAVVVAMIFLARHMLRRLGHRGMSPDGEVIQVLSRTAIGPRQQLALVRLGSRLILVGCAPDGVVRLSEITDPSEVQSLSALAEKAKAGSLRGIFRSERSGQSTTSGPQTSAGEMAQRLRARLRDKDTQ